jgi:hypothetical protein
MCSLSFVPVDDIFSNATYIIHKQYMLHNYDSDPLLKAEKRNTRSDCNTRSRPASYLKAKTPKIGHNYD